MASVNLKTKKMNILLELARSHISKFHQLVENGPNESTDTIKLVKSTLQSEMSIFIGKLDSLVNKFHPDMAINYMEMRKELTSIINEFSSIENNALSVENYDRMTRRFLKKLEIVLKNIENAEYSDLIGNIQDNMSYINKMEKVKEIEDFSKIKTFGENLLQVLGTLQHYGKELILSVERENLALYLHQLFCSFSMLVEAIQLQHQNHLPIYSAKKYICHRICWCFKRIIEIFQPESTNEEDNCNSNHNTCYNNDIIEGSFIHKIDVTLEMVSYFNGMSNDQELLDLQCDKLWTCVEDVLSHAMVIAQVSDSDNCKAISGACQSIIKEFDNMKKEIGTGFSMDKSLLINTFSDALYRLEKKVNICVLSLVLEVFSQPFDAIKKLVGMCTNYSFTETRIKQDLEDVVENFDRTVDKIMQIGYYAIASCNDTNRVIQIKSHLASLESLESVLIPSIISFYLNPRNEELRANSKLLTTQWQLAINQLRHSINLIIDPAAFCQVVLDDLQKRVPNISNNISREEVGLIIQRASSLVSQLSVALDDIGKENFDKPTIATIRELKAAIYETDAVLKDKISSEGHSDTQQLRLIKRCGLLLNVVKRLQPHLLLIMNNSDESKTQTDACNKTGSHNFLKSESRVPSNNTTFQKAWCQKENGSFVEPEQQKIDALADLSRSLIPYIEKGRVLRRERTIIMYETPKIQHKVKPDNGIKRLMQPSKQSSRDISSFRQHVFNSNTSKDAKSQLDFSSVSWNLTAILDGMSSLSNAKAGSEPNLFPENDKIANCSIIDNGNRNSSIQS